MTIPTILMALEGFGFDDLSNTLCIKPSSKQLIHRQGCFIFSLFLRRKLGGINAPLHKQQRFPMLLSGFSQSQGRITPQQQFSFTTTNLEAIYKTLEATFTDFYFEPATMLRLNRIAFHFNPFNWLE